MQTSGAELSALIGTFFWPFIRIGAMFFAAPILGTRMVPVRVRVIMAATLTLLVAPSLPDIPVVDVFSVSGFLIVLQQILIGATMGFVLQLIFSAVVMAGEHMAFSMGLGFASMIDPQNGVSVPVISQFFTVIATLLYLTMNGHAILIEVLVDSFNTMPVAPQGLDRDAFWIVISWGSAMFLYAVHIALPVVMSLMLIQLALGVMTRAAPQLHIFSVGFPVTMLMGFITIMILMRLFLPMFGRILNDGLEVTRALMAS